MRHDDTTEAPRDTSDARILPMNRAFTLAQAVAARERASELGRQLGIYRVCDNAIVIYRRFPERWHQDSTLGGICPPLADDEKESFMWDSVGSLQLADNWPSPGVATLFAVEVMDGFQLRDIERHIGLLFYDGASGGEEGHD